MLCYDSTAAMTAKALSGSTRPKSDGSVRSGDGHADRPPTRREFERMVRHIAELEGRVAQHRRDLDVQFERLAQLQAVIDRIQIAAKNARARRTTRSG